MVLNAYSTYLKGSFNSSRWMNNLTLKAPVTLIGIHAENEKVLK